MHADLYNIPDLGTPEYNVWARTIEASDLRFLWNRPRAVPIVDEDSMLKQRLDAVIWPSRSCRSIVGYEPTTSRERFEVLSVLVNRGQVLICNQYLDMSPRHWLVSKNEIEDGHLEWLKVATPMYRAAFSDGVLYAPAFGKEIEPPKDTAPVPLRDKPVAWIGFKVTDPNGNPVPNVQLEVTPPNSDAIKKATTAANGTIDVLQLETGNCTVTSNAKGQSLKNVLNIGGNAGKNAKVEEQQPLGNGPFYLAKVNEYKVKTGDSLQSIAEANGLTFRELAQFNWNTSAPDEINNHLRDDVGCTQKTQDGKNYIFDDSDEPGLLLVPATWEMQGGTHKVYSLQVRPVELPKRPVPVTVVIELLVNPNDASSRNDKFILENDDGRYKREYSIANDNVPDDDKCTLVFDGLLKDTLYTLTHDEGDDGTVKIIFEGRSYDELTGNVAVSQDEPEVAENDMQPEEEKEKTPDEDGDDTEGHVSNMNSV